MIRTPDLITIEMDGDTVMMSIERGEYFGWGSLSSRAFQVNTLLKHYN